MRSVVFRTVIMLVLLGLFLVPSRAEYPGDHSHFRILPPLPQARILIHADPSALPPGARAHFPAFDGDGIFVSLRVSVNREVTADQVFTKLITPILLSIGFPRDRIQDSFRMLPSLGLDMPRADFSGLAQDVDYEYDNNPRLLRPKTRDMIDAFLRGQGTPEIDDALETGEGMNFDQFVAGIERLEIVFPYQQVVGGVPIEHTLLLASRWEQQDVTSVRGRVFNHFDIKNHLKLTSEEAIETALKELRKLKGGDAVWEAASDPAVVLLPYGSDDQGRTRLLIVYRIDFREVEDVKLRARIITLWLDAQNGKILKLISSIEDEGVSAKGRIWNRDPGVVGTTTASFQVNPAQGGVYKLKLDHVIKLVDLYQKTDVSIAEVDPTFANFDQASINDDSQALCDAGTNDHFQEVHAFAHLYRGVQTLKSGGIFEPFPANLWGAFDGYIVDVEHVNCEANASMLFGRCEGYLNVACPNFWNGEPFEGNWTPNCMNYAHDATVIGHELGHHATKVLTDGRPDDWCNPPPNQDCAMPLETWDTFHHLADAWSSHFHSTNCDGGWVCKNRGGPGVSLYCASSDEAGGSPRRSEVTVPFHPASPADHFPEHRDVAPVWDDYARMQIPSAALWQVRLGLRSKCRPSGLPQYGVRFLRALRETGWIPYTGQNDVFMSQQLYDLELAMIEQWATSGSPNGPPAFAHNGPHTTNKVTAGFARTGLFLIPYQCLDGDPLSVDPTSCPSGESGADAVIDIDDNDPADDLSINGVTHLEVDFLEQNGPPPTFHVWTGPRYRLDGVDGLATFDNPAPCNTKFQVDISKDMNFLVGTITSPWINVDRNPNSPNSPECYDTWTPTNEEWQSIQSQEGNRLYYRARTLDADDLSLRSSTSPGNGIFVVTPPYAVITADGQSDY